MVYSDSIRRQTKEQAQVQFLVGFEVEFILLKSTNPGVEPLDRHHWITNASSPNSRNFERRFVDAKVAIPILLWQLINLGSVIHFATICCTLLRIPSNFT